MKDRSSLRDFLLSIHPVADPILDEYLSHWHHYQIPRKTVMTAPGEVERYSYFVLKGIQKSYYLTDSKQHVIAFTYPPSFSGIPESFFTQSPARYFLESITDSSFLRIANTDHVAQMAKHREIETLFRKATEGFVIGLLHRYHEMMAFDMETRFRTFTARSPHLLHMVTHKDLASYLGINPTNFSKLINSVKI